ncbi:MAG: hypothetical protein WC996_09950 [Peptostreptococcales bacterium]
MEELDDFNNELEGYGETPPEAPMGDFEDSFEELERLIGEKSNIKVEKKQSVDMSYLYKTRNYRRSGEISFNVKTKSDKISKSQERVNRKIK